MPVPVPTKQQRTEELQRLQQQQRQLQQQQLLLQQHSEQLHRQLMQQQEAHEREQQMLQHNVALGECVISQQELQVSKRASKPCFAVLWSPLWFMVHSHLLTRMSPRIGRGRARRRGRRVFW